MVLTKGVIIEESYTASFVHGVVQKSTSVCDTSSDYSDVNTCERYKKADPWYYILFYVTDIVLVLSSFVMLLLFVDWTLFVAPVRVMPVISYHILSYHISYDHISRMTSHHRSHQTTSRC